MTTEPSDQPTRAPSEAHGALGILGVLVLGATAVAVLIVVVLLVGGVLDIGTDTYYQQD